MESIGYQQIEPVGGRLYPLSESPLDAKPDPLRWLLVSARGAAETIGLAELFDGGTKVKTDLESLEEAWPSPTHNSDGSIPGRFEALIFVLMSIGMHHDIERLFAALATELHRVVDFDLI